MTEFSTIHQRHIAEIIAINLKIAKLKGEAERQYYVRDCPLKASHYNDSKLLFGQGCFEWDCEFCGKKEME